MLRILAFFLAVLCPAIVVANPATMKLELHTQSGELFAHGSAVLINRKSGCFSTSQHETAYSQVPDIRFFIRVFDIPHEAVVVWEHLEEDAAVICLKKTTAVRLPAAARPGKALPNWDTTVYTAKGYPLYDATHDDSGGFRSVEVRPMSLIAEHGLPHEAREYIAFSLQRLGVKSPCVNISSQNMISGLLTHFNDRGKKYGGISGGGLFDDDNKLIGITVMSDDTDKVYAVPITVIPEEFFEKP